MTDVAPRAQTLVVFTERDCAVIVTALRSARDEHLHTDAETAHLTRLIERLS
jgi:hypothetical protein